MRTALRLLGTRHGIALTLCVLVLMVVGAFRGVAGSRHGAPAAPLISPSSHGSVAASVADDGEADGVDSAPPSAAVSPGAATPDAVAMNFARAWLHHTGVSPDQWLAGLTPYATPALVGKLKGVDPAGVPADRVTGAIQLNTRDPGLVDTTIPVDSGTLRLRVLAVDGKWRVDGVDWQRPT